MKRLLLVSVMALILFGTLGESVICRNRLTVGDLEVPDTNGDHPWGGDNVVPITRSITSIPGTKILPMTGIGSLDLVLRVYFFKHTSRFASGRAVRAAEKNQPSVIIDVISSNSNSSGTTLTANQ